MDLHNICVINHIFKDIKFRYEIHSNNIIKIDCPRKHLPFVDNTQMDFSITKMDKFYPNDFMYLVYLKIPNAYILLVGEQYTNPLVALEKAYTIISETFKMIF